MILDSILNAPSIAKIHDELKNAMHEDAILEQSEKLKGIPILIKKLFESESNNVTGLRKISLQKLTAEASLYYFQIAKRALNVEDLIEASNFGQSALMDLQNQNIFPIEIEHEYDKLSQTYNDAYGKALCEGKPLDKKYQDIYRYALILSDLLKIEVKPSEFLPPLHIGFLEKLNYNGAAWLLNREIEKRRIQDYANDLKKLISQNEFLIKEEDKRALESNIVSYEKMIQFDFPSLSQNAINYSIKYVGFYAKQLGIELKSEQMALKEPFLIFGVDKELDNVKKFESLNYKPAQMERKFYENLILQDLFTRYLLISRIEQNLNSGLLANYFSESVSKRKKRKEIQAEKKFLENLAIKTCNFAPPTLEEWEKRTGRLLACNDSYQFLPLNTSQKNGQAPWVFYPNSSHVKMYYSKIKKQLKLINYVFDVYFSKKKKLCHFPVQMQQDIREITKQYGSETELRIEYNELKGLYMLISHFLKNDLPKQDSIRPRDWQFFWMRGKPTF